MARAPSALAELEAGSSRLSRLAGLTRSHSGRRITHDAADKSSAEYPNRSHDSCILKSSRGLRAKKRENARAACLRMVKLICPAFYGCIESQSTIAWFSCVHSSRVRCTYRVRGSALVFVRLFQQRQAPTQDDL